MTKYERFCFNVAWDWIDREMRYMSRWIEMRAGSDVDQATFEARWTALKQVRDELKPLHKEDRSNDPISG